jgi:hypothetical protein
MTRSASISRMGADFDDFLFAPIGEDRNGMLLSVLSALARLDIDPWLEAADLAGLPGVTATERLASLIASLPDEPSTHRDPRKIAARLIGLLPRRSSFNIPPHKTLLGVGAAPDSLSVIHAIAINVIIMAFVLGAQWIMASSQPPAQVDSAHASASGTVSPQMPSPDSGQ